MHIRYWGSSPDEDDVFLKNLALQAKRLKVEVEVEYIDVLMNVDRARDAEVSLTPLIDRLEPLPTLRVIAINGGAKNAIDRLLS